MAEKARRLTLCAMMAALSVVLLLTGALPLAAYCGPVLAMLPLAAAAEEAGMGWGLGTYAVAAALGALIVPEPEAVLVFACTGYYPAVKKQLDCIRRPWLQRGAKLALCVAALSLAYALATFVLGLPAEPPAMAAVLLGMGVVLFLLLDRLLGRLLLRWRRSWRNRLGFR